jgi:hypothetical protein
MVFLYMAPDDWKSKRLPGQQPLRRFYQRSADAAASRGAGRPSGATADLAATARCRRANLIRLFASQGQQEHTGGDGAGTGDQRDVDALTLLDLELQRPSFTALVSLV